MAGKRINVMVIPESTSKPKNYRVPTFLLKFSILFTIAFLAGVGILGHRYYKSSRAVSRLEVSHKKYLAQKEQIDSFVKDIDTLRLQMIWLQKMNQKFRVIAGLSQSENPQFLSGIGGENADDNFSGDLEAKIIKHIENNIRQLDVQIGIEKASLKELEETIREKKSLLGSTPTIWPVRGWVSSGFGYRNSPFTGKKEMHKGIDIATYFGSPVRVTADGVVTFSGKDGGLGKTVKIDHGYGYTTHYGHNSKLLVKAGDHVKRGQIIAKVGSTGRSTGPHLHYAVRLNKICVNPNKHLLD